MATNPIAEFDGEYIRQELTPEGIQYLRKKYMAASPIRMSGDFEPNLPKIKIKKK